MKADFMKMGFIKNVTFPAARSKLLKREHTAGTTRCEEKCERWQNIETVNM